MEEALIEVPTMRRFAGIELISDRIPDETTILSFRHLLEMLLSEKIQPLQPIWSAGPASASGSARAGSSR